jgi:hypothetical protein
MVVGTTFTWVLMPSLLRLGEERVVEAAAAPELVPAYTTTSTTDKP